MNTIFIDPTYLRTIVDGLNSGALQKDNPSALPQGLVGVYEEAIPQASKVNERKKFLEFFGVWALMKKEVSAEFVVSLLDGWSEEEVLSFIGRYSKWFNSLVSGVYTLYHERFRTFLLQKISGSQLRDINNRLIIACNDALTRRLNDEWERYALEYLSAHLLQPSLDTKERGSELKALAYNTNHWNRQIEVSKDFDWSKRLLNDMMLWASKYDDDQVIECALNKVDLHHMEQNDAPRIMDLVAQNDIETALQRIESFGGIDKEGLQRKFILYMLCLMELTLLDSKDKPFRKYAIEKLLKHFDDNKNMPVDHSILNWNDFFPSYLVFIITSQLCELDFDGLILFKRTSSWDIDWIKEKGPYSDFQINILIKCSDYFRHKTDQISILIEISNELFCQGNLTESELVLKRAKVDASITKDISKLTRISSEFYQRCNYKQSDSLILEAILITDSIKYPLIKSDALLEISIALAKQGKADEALDISNSISRPAGRNHPSEQYNKACALKEIAISLAGLGRQDEALELIKNFEYDTIKFQTLLEVLLIEIDNSNSPYFELIVEQIFEAALDIWGKLDKISSLAKLSTLFSSIQETEMSKKCMNEALKVIKQITNKPGFFGDINNGLKQISIEFAKQGKVVEAIKYIGKIKDNICKGQALIKVSEEMYLKGKLNTSHLIKEALVNVSKFKDETSDKNYLLEDLSIWLALVGEINQSIKNVKQISDQFKKMLAIKKISFNWSLNYNFNHIVKLYQEAIKINPKQENKLSKLEEIAFELFNQGKLNESIFVVQGINEKQDQFNVLIKIYTELIKNGMLNDALIVSRCIEEDWKVGVLANLSTEFAKNGNFKISSKLIQQCLKEIELFNLDLNKNIAYKDIAVQLANQSKFTKAINIVNNNIEDYEYKREAFLEIALAFAKQGMLSKAIKLNKEIFNGFETSILKEISIQFAKRGDIKKAIKFAQNINFDIIYHAHLDKFNDEKVKTLMKISIEESKLGSVNKTFELLLIEIQGLENKVAKLQYLKLVLSEALDYPEKYDLNKLLLNTLECARSITDRETAAENLIEVSILISKQFKGNIVINILREAINISMQVQGPQKTFLLINISKELLKLKQIKDSENILRQAYEFAIKTNHSYGLAEITLEYVKRSNIKNAEDSANNIINIFTRQENWEKAAKYNLNYGATASLAVSSLFHSNQNRECYLKGWAQKIKIIDSKSNVLLRSVFHFQRDISSLQRLLNNYALNQLFFDELNQEKIERYNHSLNIQWAIDIKNSFSACKS